MESYPAELDFISLFECLPRKKDEKEMFEYDETSFVFPLENIAFEVMISPFYDRFSLLARDAVDNEDIAYYNFQTVSKIEVISDRQNDSSLRLFLEYDRTDLMTVVEITFKPKFKVIMKETVR
ncbi:hypothetical protein ACSFXN_07210 [Planococcus sp. 1R117A]|uniref:hypothetical protein n=1 Tax=Planococcus sp. 1R117A TaxID=3447020 RepID=UPI003EDBA849